MKHGCDNKQTYGAELYENFGGPRWCCLVNVRSGGTSTTQNLYLESLVELLICGLDHFVVRENCEADPGESTRVLVSRGTDRT